MNELKLVYNNNDKRYWFVAGKNIHCDSAYTVEEAFHNYTHGKYSLFRIDINYVYPHVDVWDVTGLNNLEDIDKFILVNKLRK